MATELKPATFADWPITEAEIKAAMKTTEREVMYLSADLIGALNPVKLARSRTVVNQHRDHAVFVVVL